MSRRYESFVRKHFVIANESGDEFMVMCCFHKASHATMQINVESGLFICFSGKCGEKGGIKRIERHLGLRAATDSIAVSDLQERIAALRKPAKPALPVLPESALSRWNFPSPVWLACPPLKGRQKPVQGCTQGPRCKVHRGMTPDTVKAFDLGADPLGEYLTIPIRDERGGLLGVIRRFLDPEADLKYRYPKGFKRSQNLFASWLVAEDPNAHTVVLTEGSIDAIKVWQAGYPAMAVYGSSINPAQVSILRRLGVIKVILFFDNDEAGQKAVKMCRGWHETIRDDKKKWRYDAATDLRREFLVESAFYRHGFPSDPGAMTRKEVRFALRNARKVK